MDKGSAFFKSILVLLGLSSLLFMVGLQAYSHYFRGESAPAPAEEPHPALEVSNLEEEKSRLEAELEETRVKAEELVEMNARLQSAKDQFDSEKAVILEQVKDSVTSFAKYKDDTEDQITRLTADIAALENEKKGLMAEVETISSEASLNNNVFTAQMEELNNRIDGYKTEVARLREVAQKKDRDVVVSEAAKLHYNLGNFYFRNQEFESARGEYLKALTYRPDDPDAHFNLAVVYDEHLGNKTEAVRHYKTYLALRPGDENAVKIEDRVLDLELRKEALTGNTLAQN